MMSVIFSILVAFSDQQSAFSLGQTVGGKRDKGERGKREGKNCLSCLPFRLFPLSPSTANNRWLTAYKLYNPLVFSPMILRWARFGNAAHASFTSSTTPGKVQSKCG